MKKSRRLIWKAGDGAYSKRFVLLERRFQCQDDHEKNGDKTMLI